MDCHMQLIRVILDLIRKTPLPRYVKYIPYGGTFTTLLIDRVYKEQMVEVTVHDYRMYIDPTDQPIGTSLYGKGVYEQQTTDICRRFVEEGMFVADIGANIGYYSLLLSDLVGEDGLVYAFEPESHCYEVLDTNIKLNNSDNILAENLAITNTIGTSKLRISSNNKGQNRIINNSENNKTINVETQTLDNYVSENLEEKLDLIKIDIEGSEPDALYGMEMILDTHRPLIVMEFSPHLWDVEIDVVKSYLQDLNYEFRGIGPDAQLVDITPEADYPNRNIVLIPEEKN